MKKTGTWVLGAIIAIAVCTVERSVAADNELEVSSDTSKNPITGTVTETKKYKRKRKHADGTESKESIEDKKKTKTDGTTTREKESRTEEPGGH